MLMDMVSRDMEDGTVYSLFLMNRLNQTDTAISVFCSTFLKDSHFRLSFFFIPLLSKARFISCEPRQVKIDIIMLCRQACGNKPQSTESADEVVCLKLFRTLELIGIFAEIANKSYITTQYTSLFVKCNLTAESRHMPLTFFFFFFFFFFFWQFTFSVLKSSFLCQKAYVNCNNMFIKSFSVPDSPFSVFSRTAARVTLFIQLCRYGASYWSILEYSYSSADIVPNMIKVWQPLLKIHF